MRVFLSWSGPTSRQIAELLRMWLPSMLQAVKPYFTPEDIHKGKRWSDDIAKELVQCQVGIICLTRDNRDSAWIHFEAGALAKDLDKSRVIPLLAGIAPSDVTGPLSQFQLTTFNEDDIRRMVSVVNSQLEAPLPLGVLNSTFDMWWPKLSEPVAALLAAAPMELDPDLRTDRDVLDEILSLARGGAFSRGVYDEMELSYVPPAIPVVPTDGGQSIATLDVTDRVKNLLIEYGILTVEQLEQMTEIDLLRRPNIGRLALGQISNALSRHGKKLAQKA